MKRSGSASDPLWYKDAIIYELPVKAFYDSNQDGIGDFGGLLQKLDYLQDLGVTCLWLLPFFPSPLRDDGYDISDYCNVHPSYGSLDDFRAFLNAAHDRDMIGALKFGQGTLRHEHRIRFDLRLRSHATVLTRTQNEIRVGKESNYLERAGIGIDLAVGEGKSSFFGINRTVGKNQLQREIFVRIIGSDEAPPKRQIRLLADLKIHFDRIDG